MSANLVDLPFDVLETIFTHAGESDIRQLAACCRHLRHTLASLIFAEYRFPLQSNNASADYMLIEAIENVKCVAMQTTLNLLID